MVMDSKEPDQSLMEMDLEDSDDEGSVDDERLIDGKEMSVLHSDSYFSYFERKRRLDYDLDPELPDEVKDFYMNTVVCTDPELISRPSTQSVNFDCKLSLFRRLLVERLQLDLNEELLYLQQAMEDYPENDQMWFHRRWTLLKLGAKVASDELKFTDRFICRDAKNSLSWSHREWVFQEFGGDLEQELEYCDKVIREDVFNSFAWDQRYFVVSSIGIEVTRDQEVDYALESIGAETRSECPWTYITRLYTNHSQALVNDCRVENICLSVLKSYIDLVQVPNLAEEGANVESSGCANALKMAQHLIKLGLPPSYQLLDVIKALSEDDLEFDFLSSIRPAVKRNVFEPLTKLIPVTKLFAMVCLCHSAFILACWNRDRFKSI